MKTVCDLDMCTGCMACIETCTKGAISLVDSLKSLNAVIDDKACIQCGACHKVCQIVHPLKLQKPLSWFQGWTNDSHSREKSSSGGFAYNIMKQFLNEGGMVCSCAFSNGEFAYEIATCEEDLEKFRGSKYVKSSMGTIYSKIKELIESEQKVLFLGLPCHVAGVIKYIGESDKTQKYLYTVDLICHGSPSVEILSRFLDEKGFKLDNLRDIAFRQKNKFRIVVNEDEKRGLSSITPQGVRDRYTISFLNGLFYTENCYSCRYAGINRISDITIGDSWGSDLEETEEGNKGISLALCQTKRGEELLKRSNLKLLDVDLERAVAANHQLQNPSKMPDERDTFFLLIAKGTAVNKAIAKCYPWICKKQDLKSFLIRKKIIKRS